MSCNSCSRVIVFLLNIAMVLVALTVIGLSLWLWFDQDFEKNIRDNIKIETNQEPLYSTKKDIRTGITVSFAVIVGVAAALTIVGLLALIGAASGNRAIIVIYFVLQFLLILLEIAVGIYVLVVRKNVRTTVKDYVMQSYQMNTVDVTTFQLRYSCCGVENMANPQCIAGNMPTCSSAVWDRLDFSMMIFGFSMIGVVVLQIISTITSLGVFTRAKNEPFE